MDLYLAGVGPCVGTGRVILEAQRRNMNVYLAGGETRVWCIDEYLSGRERPLGICNNRISGGVSSMGEKAHIPDKAANINILMSFYYIDDVVVRLIPRFKNFMLDSGAFTYLVSGKHINWDEYVSRYIDFIKTYKVEKFFELDIDPLIGYEKVKKIRQRIEHETGKQCIPVWHRSRGKEEFLRMCEEYPYVALGGIAVKEIKRTEHKYFPWFINEAHKRGAKIHGLGYTNLKGLKKYHFDSVDSSAWTAGNRFGFIYKFNGKEMVKHIKPEGYRVKPKETAINNFVEWVKFSQYAASHY